MAAGLMSAFMNNIAAAVVLMPAVGSISQRSGVSPSRLFMPLSFGAILGGTDGHADVLGALDVTQQARNGQTALLHNLVAIGLENLRIDENTGFLPVFGQIHDHQALMDIDLGGRQTYTGDRGSARYQVLPL